MRFTKKDLIELTETGHIVMAAKDAKPLLVVTMDYLQTLADGFAAGHAVTIGDEVIVGDPDNSVCPECGGCDHDDVDMDSDIDVNHNLN